MEHLAARAKESVERYITLNTRFIPTHAPGNKIMKSKLILSGRAFIDGFEFSVASQCVNLKLTLERDYGDLGIYTYIIIKTYIDDGVLTTEVEVY